MNLFNIIIKDFRDAFRNRTILVALLLPVVASLLFAVIGSSGLSREFEIGIIEESGNLQSFIHNNTANIKTQRFQEIENGVNSVRQGVVSGLIVVNKEKDYNLYLNTQQPLMYYFLKDNLTEMLDKYNDVNRDYKMKLVSVNNPTARLSFLPVWITITITMIGVMIISGNIAEEKENRTLDFLFISPLAPWKTLTAKALFGVIFICLTIGLMSLLNGVFSLGIKVILNLFLVTVTGAFCFTILGLLIGIIAGSQSSARSIGTIIYFPLLFPALIYDLSEFTRKLAAFFPTYYLFKLIENVLIYQRTVFSGNFLSILFIFTLALSIITLIKIRDGGLHEK